MNNENFAGIMGTVKQAEVTSGVCGYDTENRYVVLRVCVPRKSGAEDTVIVAAKIKENENIDAETIARNMVVEGVLKDGDFKIANNKLLQSHFLNVALKHNMETRKFRPIKIEQRAHIDGFVSVIDAMTVRQKYHEEVGELLKNAA